MKNIETKVKVIKQPNPKELKPIKSKTLTVGNRPQTMFKNGLTKQK